MQLPYIYMEDANFENSRRKLYFVFFQSVKIPLIMKRAFQENFQNWKIPTAAWARPWKLDEILENFRIFEIKARFRPILRSVRSKITSFSESAVSKHSKTVEKTEKVKKMTKWQWKMLKFSKIFRNFPKIGDFGTQFSGGQFLTKKV